MMEVTGSLHIYPNARLHNIDISLGGVMDISQLFHHCFLFFSPVQ
jgi:hypothetical protein